MSAFLQGIASSWLLAPAALAAAAAVLAGLQLHRLWRRSWRVVAAAPDPGNAPHQVRVVERRGIPGRWLEVRDGTPPHRLYLLPTDARAVDPIHAVAATYGMSRGEYLRIEKRS